MKEYGYVRVGVVLLAGGQIAVDALCRHLRRGSAGEILCRPCHLIFQILTVCAVADAYRRRADDHGDPYHIGAGFPSQRPAYSVFFVMLCPRSRFSPVTRNIRQKCSTVSRTPGSRKPRRFSPTSGRPVPAGRPDPRCCRKSCNRTAPASSTPPAAASRGWPRRSAGTGFCSCCCRTA